MNEQVLLHGKSDDQRIVGLHIDDEYTELEGHTMIRYYTRDENDRVESHLKELSPFFYLSDMSFLNTFPDDAYEWFELEGDNFYKYIVVFDDWFRMWKAVGRIKERAFDMGITDQPKAYPPHIYIIKTPEEQFLIQHGMTLFKGMEFEETHRLHWDIETFSHRDGFPNPTNIEDKIIIMTLSDNRGYSEVLYLDECGISPAEIEGNATSFPNEVQLLQYFVRIILEKDPDVIVGHNVFAFDFWYTITRCEIHDVSFHIGRNHGVPDTYESSKRFAERDISYLHVKIPGRHIIDTYFETMNYDVFARDLPGYGLKIVAKYFGFATEDREYVEGDKISWYWQNDPMPLLRYAKDDTRECSDIDSHLGGATFFTTTMLPMTYQRVGVAGTAAKIESLLVREYLRVLHSMPTREQGKQEVGGYTDIFKTGVYNNIVYADVASLYPSIMLNYKIQPEGDDLELFPNALQLLTDLRFKTKRKRDEFEKGTKEYQKYDSMQSSYKVLINSFYGSLGFHRFIFNDFSEADRVTVIGQDLLKTIIALIEEDGGEIVEVDTDGVLAMAPDFVYTLDDKEDEARAYDYCIEQANQYFEESGATPDYEIELHMLHDEGFEKPIDDVSYVKSLTERMPEGIVIDFDGRAVRMISYKKKNYALREPGKDKIKIKGGSLISRLYEKFGIEYMASVIEALMNRDVQKIAEIHRFYYDKIANGKWEGVEEFMKKSTLKDAIETYIQKVKRGSGNGGRNKDAAYELAIQRFKDNGLRPEPGDRIRYFIGGKEKAYKVRAFQAAEFAESWEPGSENTYWYLDRLKKFGKKFEKFFSKEHYKLIFSDAPIKDINFAEIQILNKDVEREKVAVIMHGADTVSDMFWVKRAVAGAKFLKSLDSKDNGMEIGMVITTESSGFDENVKEWASEMGYGLLTVKADEESGAQKHRVQATTMIELAQNLDMKPAMIIVDDEKWKNNKLAVALTEAREYILNPKGKPVIPIHISHTV